MTSEALEAEGAIGPTGSEGDARLRALADNLPHAMIFQVAVAPDGLSRRFTFVGRSCERVNGVSAEAALADPDALYGLVAPEDRDRMAAAEADAIAGKHPFDVEACFIRPDGERRWHRISSAPRFLADGTTLWDGIQLDVTESRRASEALAHEQSRLELAIEATGLGLWEFDLRTSELYWAETVKAVYGLPADAPVTYETYLAAVHPEDREQATATFTEAVGSGANGYRMEHRTVGPDGTVRWVLGCARIVRDRHGEAVRLIGSTLDITERKRAEERLRLMVHELNHRVKNSMAVVQAISSRTLRDSDSPEAAARNLTSRLLALARAHDLLTAESWEGADLAEVVSRSLGAVGAAPERLQIAGPRFRLRPTAALTFALVFHELATNALKYGALSSECGRLSVEWSLDPAAQRLRLSWRESGGPPVSPPSRKGFGTQLIQRGLAVEAAGDVRLDYAPEGLVCTIEGDAERLAPRA